MLNEAIKMNKINTEIQKPYWLQRFQAKRSHRQTGELPFMKILRKREVRRLKELGNSSLRHNPQHANNVQINGSGIFR